MPSCPAPTDRLPQRTSSLTRGAMTAAGSVKFTMSDDTLRNETSEASVRLFAYCRLLYPTGRHIAVSR